MTRGNKSVLLAGISTRALAESAARAGFRVWAADGFGDLDQQQVATVAALSRGTGRPYRAAAAVAAARRLAPQARYVAYVSNLENHPDLVTELARSPRGSRLLGNPAAVLGRVRDPLLLARILERHGVEGPATRGSPPPPGDRRPWLLKRRHSGGGRGIVPWRPGMAVPRSRYLQQRVSGIPCSLVFATDGETVIPFGWSRQLVGDRRFGLGGFSYTGNILCRPDDRAIPRGTEAYDRAVRVARILTAAFGLVGVNGVDFMVRNGVPFPVEVNPRYSASMELVERAQGLSIFGLHLAACRNRLRADAGTSASLRRAEGKAVVYARRQLILGDTTRWLSDPSLRDIPVPGERIGRGHPICTVFATGRDSLACHAALVRRARQLFQEVARMTRGAV